MPNSLDNVKLENMNYQQADTFTSDYNAQLLQIISPREASKKLLNKGIKILMKEINVAD